MCACVFAFTLFKICSQKNDAHIMGEHTEKTQRTHTRTVSLFQLSFQHIAIAHIHTTTTFFPVIMQQYPVEFSKI